ncbi:IS481 family transposase [Leucobacter salsicius]
MSSNVPIKASIRLAIVQWPEDAPRGSVTAFCHEHEISRNTFYKIQKRARVGSPAQALEPRPRTPRTTPNRIPDTVREQSIAVRAALDHSGLDHGPISVHDKMKTLGLAAPSVATLARIFRAAGVARVEPKKKPRTAFRRFVYPFPNACWQLDATEYVLAGGRKCVIFQLIDDHSRLAIASLVAASETSQAAIEVVQQGIARHGVPQRLLTDNGAALNPTRRGRRGALVEYVSALGVEPITGKPYKPTTQGKNERFHQTLMRWLDKHPLARDLVELQALVDEFDAIYNTERPHQGLPGRITPLQAWNATEVAAPPTPPPLVPGGRTRAKPDESGEAVKVVGRNGQAAAIGTMFYIGERWIGRQVHVVWVPAEVCFYTSEGEFLIRYARPPHKTVAVSRRDSLDTGPALDEVSPMS